MILVEMLFAGILAFAAGSYIGQKKGKQQASTEKRQPDVWQPSEHKTLLKQCGMMCGENNLKSYSVTWGKCECK